MLEDISAGRPVRRRDAVMMAREVLESELVRAAEAVLEADDNSLCARVVDLLRVALAEPEHSSAELATHLAKQR